MAEEVQKKIRIDKALGFFRVTATDAVISGPTPDGATHLSFLADRAILKSQSIRYSNPERPDEGGQLFWGEDDTQMVRELLGQVSLPSGALLSLFAALSDRLVQGGFAEEVAQIAQGILAKSAGSEER